MSNPEESLAYQIDPGVRIAQDGARMIMQDLQPQEHVKKSKNIFRRGVAAIGLSVASLAGMTAHEAAENPDYIEVDASFDTRIRAGGTLRVNEPKAVGGKTIVANLAATNQAGRPGFVTAYGCDNGLPREASGRITKSDLNHDGSTTSNRLIVEADNDGDICFYTSQTADLVVDINGVFADTAIESFPNKRTDTRKTGSIVRSGQTLRVNEPKAVGGKTIVANLAATNQAGRPGFVTAYGCDNGLPREASGRITKSDLNHDGSTTSNRLIVEADNDGDICFYTSQTADLVVDINGVFADTAIESFPNKRTDTRDTTPPEFTVLSGSGDYFLPSELDFYCKYGVMQFLGPFHYPTLKVTGLEKRISGQPGESFFAYAELPNGFTFSNSGLDIIFGATADQNGNAESTASGGGITYSDLGNTTDTSRLRTWNGEIVIERLPKDMVGNNPSGIGKYLINSVCTPF